MRSLALVVLLACAKEPATAPGSGPVNVSVPESASAPASVTAPVSASAFAPASASAKARGACVPARCHAIGMCDAYLRVPIWNGTTCTFFEGSGCDIGCTPEFTSVAACRAACGP